MAPTESKALVLGGKNGLLGRALVDELDSGGWSVFAAGSGDINFLSNNFSDALKRLIDAEEPLVVFNAVGYTNVELAEEHEDEAMCLNRAVPAALGAISRTRPFRLVHYSTDFVFDGRKSTPYLTDDSTNPLSVYGRTKLAGEQALQSFDLPDCLIIRTAWLFGPYKKNFVRTILNICHEKRQATVVSDQLGSPTYTVDLARHSLSLVEVGKGGIYHIVNSGQASWCELADEAAKCVQFECRITPVATEDFPHKANRPGYSVLDCSSFTQATGITIRPWPQALREYLLHELPGLDE